MFSNLRSLALVMLLVGPSLAFVGCASDETVQPAKVEPVPADAPVNEPPSTDEQ